MSRIRCKNTKPELAVRQLLHKMGYRFRLHRNDLPGRPDVTLPKWRTVIFVHGCFWHGCSKCDKGLRRPRTNAVFWEEKINSNVLRDCRVNLLLSDRGWKVVTVWECELKKPELLRKRLLFEIGGIEEP